MKGILLLNGEPYRGEIGGALDGAKSLVVCCDGAYRWAKGKVRIDENVGDFDSLDEAPMPAPKAIYPTEKDFTDGEIGLFRLLDSGCDEIEIYGGGGGREDHFLGNVHLLYAALMRGARATMRTNDARIFLVRDRAELSGMAGKTVSLLPFGGEARVGKSSGFYYPLAGLVLSYGSCRTLSNVVQSDDAYFEVDFGTVLVLINDPSPRA
jgi:thiamine pyrophosphokinase